MARFSISLALFAAACLASLSSGCKTVRGPDGERALWSTTDSSPATKKDLKEPAKTNLAYALWQEQLGQLGSARQFYQMSLEHDPKSVEAILGIARLDQLAGREQLAEEGVNKALQIKPNDPFVQHSAGQFYASKNQWQKAGDLLSRAMMAEPENATYRFDFAVALARAGRPDQAMPHFVKSCGEAEAHFNVAYILAQQGKSDQAEFHLRQALAKDPNLKPAQKLLADIRGVNNDRSALAIAGQPVNGVSQASMNVPAGASNVRPQAPTGRGRLVMNGQQQQQSLPPRTAVRPTPTYQTMQPTPQTSSSYQQVEQWNKETGVW